MKARMKAIVSGYVQGVGYRFFCHHYAIKLGLVGYAKNLWDGKVEVVVEGDKDKILEYLDLLKKGPISSEVKDVQATLEEYKGEFNNFGIY